MQRLEVRGCPALQEAVVCNCYDLREIMLEGGLQALKRVKIVGCSALQRVVGLKNLQALTHMVVHDCCSLAKVDLGGLGALEELTFSGSCDSLEEVTGWTALTSLTKLRVDGTLDSRSGYQEDPETALGKLLKLDLRGLCALKQLQLKECWRLQTLDITGLNELTQVEGGGQCRMGTGFPTHPTHRDHAGC
jgi:hypothetical protein